MLSYGWKQSVPCHGVVNPRAGDNESAHCSQERQSQHNGENAGGPRPKQIFYRELGNPLSVVKSHIGQRYCVSENEI